MAQLSKTTKIIASSAVAVAAGSSAIADPSWDGFYVGGSFNTFPAGFNDGGSDYDVVSLGSGFAGYNMSFGAVVVGAEVNAFLGDIDAVDYVFSNAIDVKAKVGTTFGSALVYATIGYSFGTSNDYAFSQPFGGMAYGVGVDYMVSDNFFVGADYVTRIISDTNYLDARPLSTLSIRAGYKF